MNTILITGGAGYIGSHTAYLLSQLGNKIIIIDKLLQQQTFPHSWAMLIKEDFGNESVLTEIFTKNPIDAVIHFAAFIEVGESVKKPKEFYDNNLIKTLTLLNTMLKHNIKKFIFSSSCAIYGEPVKTPMDETNPYKPISPYGKNKLSVEFALQDYAVAYNLEYVALRYFNAAGAMPDVGLGEQHIPETHIIPLMIRAIKQEKPFKIFGTDYTTTDGTCIRDYIHVKNLASHPNKSNIFESFIIADILKHYHNHGADPRVYFWQDKTENEVDCIIEEKQKLIPIEIKSGELLINGFLKALIIGILWHIKKYTRTCHFWSFITTSLQPQCPYKLAIT